MYLERTLTQTLQKYLTLFPVVSLTGPRQSGKSTLLKQMLGKTYRYVTFDDFQMLSMAEDDSVQFMKTYDNHVIFDEIQKAPQLLSAMKLQVDDDRQSYGKFIVTGSNQLMMNQHIAETLAGRIGLLTLLPLSCAEIPDNLRAQSIYAGGYPELVVRGYNGSAEWYSSYLGTYIERDVKDLKNIGNLRDFRRLIELLASRTAQILNMSELAGSLGVAVSTIKIWISILEASYIVYLLPPYFNNYGKRITKSPKIYFYDTGLVSFLTGVYDQISFEKGPMYGALFENYIVMECLKKYQCSLYFLRTHSGEEIDLLIDLKTHRICLEIKTSHSYNVSMSSALKKYAQPGDQSFVIYQGETLPYAPARNYKEFLLLRDG